MADKYRIRPGASFRAPDGTLYAAGDVIELDSDVALTHHRHLEPVPAADAAGWAVSKAAPPIPMTTTTHS